MCFPHVHQQVVEAMPTCLTWDGLFELSHWQLTHALRRKSDPRRHSCYSPDAVQSRGSSKAGEVAVRRGIGSMEIAAALQTCLKLPEAGCHSRSLTCRAGGGAPMPRAVPPAPSRPRLWQTGRGAPRERTRGWVSLLLTVPLRAGGLRRWRHRRGGPPSSDGLACDCGTGDQCRRRAGAAGVGDSVTNIVSATVAGSGRHHDVASDSKSEPPSQAPGRRRAQPEAHKLPVAGHCGAASGSGCTQAASH